MKRKYLISCIVSGEYRCDLKEGISLIDTSLEGSQDFAYYGITVIDPCLVSRSLLADIREDVISCKVDCLVVDHRIAKFCDSIAKEFGSKPVRIISVFFDGDTGSADYLAKTGIVVADAKGAFSCSDGFTRACEYAINSRNDKIISQSSYQTAESQIIGEGSNGQSERRRYFSLKPALRWIDEQD